MIDVQHHLSSVRRTLGDRTLEAGEARELTLSRTFPTTVDDLWDAVTDPERLPRWFLPVSGDLRLGGRYQLEGNAGGEITMCDPPSGFDATWEMGDQVSWIELRLSPAADGATFALTHIAHVDERWDEFGPSAVGIGWDLAVMGLTLHLASGEAVDPAEVAGWSASSEGLAFMRTSGAAWADADIAAGADPDAARAASERTVAFYTTPPEEPGDR